MKPQLALILLLLVCLPLGLLAWLGYETARGEQERARAELVAVLGDRLMEIRTSMAETIRETAVTVDQLLVDTAWEVDAWRHLARSQPLVRQVFAASGNRNIVYPGADSQVPTAEETAFLRRVGSLDEVLVDLDAGGGEQASATAMVGWHPWFHGRGRHVLYWRRLPMDSQDLTSLPVVGCEVDRSALIAALIEDLPTDRLENGRIALRDESTYPIYQWGHYDPGNDANPAAEIPAPPPFESWRLAYFVPDRVGLPHNTGAVFSLTAALLAVGGLTVLLGGYFYWAHTRELRDAEQRVSFVNQVSHELKTPLTNIRMYAELAENKLHPDDTAAQECLGVVVAESSRLSRLIQNVLTFAKQQRGTVPLHGALVNPDEVIRTTLESFQPALAEAAISSDIELACPEAMQIDRDVLEQILSNLIGNVIKYAAEGKILRVRSQQSGREITVEISDQGPGIPDRWQHKVFAPFSRVSDRVTDGVAGTGIGLSIARQLARQHGGNLTLVKADHGATFRLILKPLPSS